MKRTSLWVEYNTTDIASPAMMKLLKTVINKTKGILTLMNIPSIIIENVINAAALKDIIIYPIFIPSIGGINA